MIYGKSGLILYYKIRPSLTTLKEGLKRLTYIWKQKGFIILRTYSISNCYNAWSPETHKKNGAKPKSLMSRGI